ncbi:MAG: transketolase [Candidatus Coatesbacteria bacterium]|nr:transketolase [Candidatus Coatesbacteria bacterium]
MIEAEEKRLSDLALKTRILILNMLAKAGSGHTGGSLSVVEILTYLYFYKMRHKVEDPAWPDRDRLVLSKGHAAPALYAALSMCGYFPRSELFKLRRLAGSLQGHPDIRRTSGVEATTGSLGQGLSIANGIALGLRLSGTKGLHDRVPRVYAILGDGELQEGQVWEAAMSASHYRLSNVVAFVDANGLQIDGRIEKVMSLEPLTDKWKAFGWNVQEIDGHSFGQLDEAVQHAENCLDGGPNVIVARTTKGKGVSFMEGKASYHGVAPTMDELSRAMQELGGEILSEVKS